MVIDAMDESENAIFVKCDESKKFQLSQLTCNVTSNGITNASTINLRANSGNAGPAVSIIGSSTGIFNDNTDTYSARWNKELFRASES